MLTEYVDEWIDVVFIFLLQSISSDLDVTEESSASDVFRVIFSAMATSEPWKSLLMHAVVLRNPLFAELAGCLVGFFFLFHILLLNIWFLNLRMLYVNMRSLKFDKVQRETKLSLIY